MEKFMKETGGQKQKSLNHLLSIILYSDASTFDRLGKISDHPVFLILGNLSNYVRNLPEAKVLLGSCPRCRIRESKLQNHLEIYNMKYIRNASILCFDLCWKNLIRYILGLKAVK